MVVKDIGGGFVGVHLGKNTKEGCDWWVLGEMRIMAITNNSTEIWKKDQVSGNCLGLWTWSIDGDQHVSRKGGAGRSVLQACLSVYERGHVFYLVSTNDL